MIDPSFVDVVVAVVIAVCAIVVVAAVEAAAAAAAVNVAVGVVGDPASMLSRVASVSLDGIFIAFRFQMIFVFVDE